MQAVEDWDKVVLVFQTDESLKPEEAEKSIRFIRSYLEQNVSPDVAETLRILYGGKVDKNNAQQLIEQNNIDGFFLDHNDLSKDFLEITEIVKRACPVEEEDSIDR